LVKKIFAKSHDRGKSGPEFKKFHSAILKKQGALVIPKENKAPRVKIEYKDTEQAQLALGWPAYKYLDKRLPALSVLSTILGGTMSSRLFISVQSGTWQNQTLAGFAA
jgi:predicted Zn-dependent peptidase